MERIGGRLDAGQHPGRCVLRGGELMTAILPSGPPATSHRCAGRRRSRLARDRPDLDAGDPAPVHRRHGEHPVVAHHGVARLPANRPSPAIRKPAAVSYGPGGSTMPVTSAKSSRFSRPSTSCAPPDRRGVGPDRRLRSDHLADDLLDQVLERDDAVGAAVLVHHHREMLTRRAHFLQRVEHHLGAGDDGDRCADIAHAGRPAERVAAGRAGRAGAPRRPPRRSRGRSPGTANAGAPARVRAARETDIDAGRNSTSGAGTITSRTRVVSASNTSTIIRRSTTVSDSWASTSDRSSSGLITSPAGRWDCRAAAGPPGRTTRRAARRPGGTAGPARPAARTRPARCASLRCSPSRLGASSPSTSDRNEMIRVIADQRERVGGVLGDMPQLDPASRPPRARPSRRRTPDDSIVATVIPICTDARNRFGSATSRASRCPRRPAGRRQPATCPSAARSARSRRPRRSRRSG